jgi:hypothetical protein
MLFRRAAALLPMGMSLAALALVVGYAVRFGTARQADEGTAAHLWQLLMAGQLPIIAFFAAKWIPIQPAQAALVLAAQAACACAAMLPVWWFHW